MATIRVEDFWKTRLLNQGWPKRAADQLPLAWATTTRKQYDQVINKFAMYCVQKGHAFPPKDTVPLVEYLCVVADGSDRPESSLKSTCAAFTWLFNATGLPNLTRDSDVQRLVSALIKSGTKLPRCKSKVMPVSAFNKLFSSWKSSEELSIQELRLKALTLLSLSLMLRPSDVSPNGVVYNPDTGGVEQLTFSTSDITPNDDGSLSITFLGIKNDTHREGFSVSLQPCDQEELDPVQALLSYINKTADQRTQVTGAPVFLSLNRPYKQLSGQGIAQVLNKAIEMAGLKGQGFSAKSFRPTGATHAVDNGYDPDMIMKVGKWKTREVFMEHYVHSKTPASFTNDMLAHE